MSDLASVFKSYDIRGRVGDELNADFAQKVGRAFADWLPEAGTVAVGRDMRPDSGELADAVIAGLRAQGRDVLDIGQVTSDMIYFAVGSLQLAGGAMITASHNPGKDNGIKLCREEAKPVGLDTGLDQIRDAVLAGKFADAGASEGNLEKRDLSEDWVQHVLSFIDADKLKPLRLAVDAGNGMAGAIFPELEPYVPWEITEMYFDLDGTFPNHEANPLKFETLKDLIARIRADKLDGGIAFDGDGDRAFLVDETGTPLTGGVMSAMMAEYFVGLHPGANIVYDIRNSRSVPRVVTEAGGTAVISKVGHSIIKQKMRDADAPFGGEASGHFYFRDNWYADSGLIGAVIGLYVAGLSGKKLSELREFYTHFKTIPETNFTVADKDAALARIQAAFPQPEHQHDNLDGLTVVVNDHTWFNVRGSNTEPVMRLNAESSDQKTLDDLVAKVKDLING
jgi:phosphomannomutase